MADRPNKGLGDLLNKPPEDDGGEQPVDGAQPQGNPDHLSPMINRLQDMGQRQGKKQGGDGGSIADQHVPKDGSVAQPGGFDESKVPKQPLDATGGAPASKPAPSGADATTPRGGNNVSQPQPADGNSPTPSREPGAFNEGAVGQPLSQPDQAPDSDEDSESNLDELRDSDDSDAGENDGPEGESPEDSPDQGEDSGENEGGEDGGSEGSNQSDDSKSGKSEGGDAKGGEGAGQAAKGAEKAEQAAAQTAEKVAEKAVERQAAVAVAAATSEIWVPLLVIIGVVVLLVTAVIVVILWIGVANSGEKTACGPEGGPDSTETASALKPLNLELIGTANAQKGGPPQKYIKIYQAAADKYKLGPKGPSILAAIHDIESDFGTSTAPGVKSGLNFAKCCAGPMQFSVIATADTWGSFGVDGDGNGKKDVYNNVDAIFSAANYLKASGAPGSWYKAIFTYNNADWYVKDVEARAAKYKIPAKGGTYTGGDVDGSGGGGNEAGAGGGKAECEPGEGGGEGGGVGGVPGLPDISDVPVKPAGGGYGSSPGGHYQLPKSKYYTSYAPPSQQTGSKCLVKLIIATSKAWKQKYPKDTVRVGDLNAPGHASHGTGIDVDISTGTAANMATGGYSKDKSIEYGKLWFSTGSIVYIFFNDASVRGGVNGYAKQNKLPGVMQQWPNHEDHFHVRLKIDGNGECAGKPIGNNPLGGDEDKGGGKGKGKGAPKGDGTLRTEEE